MPGFYGRNVPRDNTSDIPVLTDIIYYKVGEGENGKLYSDKQNGGVVKTLDEFAKEDSVYINRYILVEENKNKSLYQKRYENGPHYIFISKFSIDEEIDEINRKLNANKWEANDILTVGIEDNKKVIIGKQLNPIVCNDKEEEYGIFSDVDQKITLQLKDINTLKTQINTNYTFPDKADDKPYSLDEILTAIVTNGSPFNEPITLSQYLDILYHIIEKGMQNKLAWNDDITIINGGNASGFGSKATLELDKLQDNNT